MLVQMCKIIRHWKFSCSNLVMKEKKDHAEMHSYSRSFCCSRCFRYMIMKKTMFHGSSSMECGNSDSWNEITVQKRRLSQENFVKVLGNISSYLNYFHGVQIVCNWNYLLFCVNTVKWPDINKNFLLINDNTISW